MFTGLTEPAGTSSGLCSSVSLDLLTNDHRSAADPVNPEAHLGFILSELQYVSRGRPVCLHHGMLLLSTDDKVGQENPADTNKYPECSENVNHRQSRAFLFISYLEHVSYIYCSSPKSAEKPIKTSFPVKSRFSSIWTFTNKHGLFGTKYGNAARPWVRWGSAPGNDSIKVTFFDRGRRVDSTHRRPKLK